MDGAGPRIPSAGVIAAGRSGGTRCRNPLPFTGALKAASAPPVSATEAHRASAHAVFPRKALLPQRIGGGAGSCPVPSRSVPPEGPRPAATMAARACVAVPPQGPRHRRKWPGRARAATHSPEAGGRQGADRRKPGGRSSLRAARPSIGRANPLRPPKGRSAAAGMTIPAAVRA